MAVTLRKEVVDRLLLSKFLLREARFHPVAEPDRFFLAVEVLKAHDAADLAIAAIAAEREKLPAKRDPSLMDYFEKLRELHPEREVTGKDYFGRLNHVRNGVKHRGVFPDLEWARAGENVYDHVSQWCQEYLELSFEDLDESALLASPKVKEHFDSAKQALAEQKYEQVLVQGGKGLHTLFKENSALRGLEVGTAKSEDAIRLTGFGVHANDFLALQEFLPKIVEGKGGALSHKWELNQFGHPANWREESAHFCLNTSLDVALKLQNARWIPGALPFDLAYDCRITALKDGVQIESERTYLAGLGAPPFETLLGKRRREIYRTLSRGESLLGRIISRDLMPPREDARGVDKSEEAYEIRFSSGGLDMIGHILFVAEIDVKITCVPSEFIRQYLPGLSEFDWKPA